MPDDRRQTADLPGIPGLLARLEAALSYSRSHEDDRVTEMEWRAHLAELSTDMDHVKPL